MPRTYTPSRPEDELDPENFCVRLTRGVSRDVAAIASRELTSRAAVIRRVLVDGIRRDKLARRRRERADAT